MKVREGIVTGREGRGEVKVTVLNDTDCEDCDGTCGSAENSFEVTAKDTMGAGQGDRVQVEIEPRSFGKIAFITFGIPVIALMGGLGLGSWLSTLVFNGNYSNLLPGATAGTLFLISLVGLVGYDRYLASESPNRAEITEILNDKFDCSPDAGSVDSTV